MGRQRWRPGAWWGRMPPPMRGLFERDELHFEDEEGVGRNDTAGAAFAIGELGRDDREALFANGHIHDRFVPTGDDLALADDELDGPAMELARVEDLAGEEHPLVVDLYLLAGGGLCPGSGGENLVEDARIARFEVRVLRGDGLEVCFALFDEHGAGAFCGRDLEGVEGGLAGLEGEGVGAVADNRDAHHLVALLDHVDDMLSFDDLAEDAVLVVEPWGGDMGDKELRAVGAGSRVGHGQDAGALVAQAGVELVVEAVAGAAATVTARVAGLDHEVVDDPVETDAVVEGLALCRFHRALCQGDKVADGKRYLLVLELEDDFAAVGVDTGEDAGAQIAVLAGGGNGAGHEEEEGAAQTGADAVIAVHGRHCSMPGEGFARR